MFLESGNNTCNHITRNYKILLSIINNLLEIEGPYHDS